MRSLDMHPKLAEHYKDIAEPAGNWEVVVGDIGHFCACFALTQTTFGSIRATPATTSSSATSLPSRYVLLRLPLASARIPQQAAAAHQRPPELADAGLHVLDAVAAPQGS